MKKTTKHFFAIIIILININSFAHKHLSPKSFVRSIAINTSGEKVILTKEGNEFLIKEEQKEIYGMQLFKISLYNKSERIGFVHFRVEGKSMVLNTMINDKWSFIPGVAIYVEPKYKNEFKNIGRSLMNIAISEGVKCGAVSCSLYNILEEDNVEEFYKKIGFSVINENAYKKLDTFMMYPEISISRKEINEGSLFQENSINKGVSNFVVMSA